MVEPRERIVGLRLRSGALGGGALRCGALGRGRALRGGSALRRGSLLLGLRHARSVRASSSERTRSCHHHAARLHRRAPVRVLRRARRRLLPLRRPRRAGHVPNEIQCDTWKMAAAPEPDTGCGADGNPVLMAQNAAVRADPRELNGVRGAHWSTPPRRTTTAWAHHDRPPRRDHRRARLGHQVERPRRDARPAPQDPANTKGDASGSLDAPSRAAPSRRSTTRTATACSTSSTSPATRAWSATRQRGGLASGRRTCSTRRTC